MVSGQHTLQYNHLRPFTTITPLEKEDGEYLSLSDGLFQEVFDPSASATYGHFTFDPVQQAVTTYHAESHQYELIDPVAFAYNFGARMYDARLGRFLSTDPLASSFPHYSPYLMAGNKPINHIDLKGEHEFEVIYNHNTGQVFIRVISTINIQNGENGHRVRYIDIKADGSEEESGWQLNFRDHRELSAISISDWKVKKSSQTNSGYAWVRAKRGSREFSSRRFNFSLEENGQGNKEYKVPTTVPNWYIDESHAMGVWNVGRDLFEDEFSSKDEGSEYSNGVVTLYYRSDNPEVEAYKRRTSAAFVDSGLEVRFQEVTEGGYLYRNGAQTTDFILSLDYDFTKKASMSETTP